MPIHQAYGTGVPIAQATLLGAAPTSLNVPMLRQEQSNWCWVACTLMTLSFYEPTTPTRQCDIVNYHLNQTNCCNPTTAASVLCNQTVGVQDVAPIHAHYGTDCDSLMGTVPFASVEAILKSGSPLEIAFAWDGGGGHVAMVRGITSDDMIQVNDPWDGRHLVTYNKLTAAYGRGSWFWTWKHFRR